MKIRNVAVAVFIDDQNNVVVQERGSHSKGIGEIYGFWGGQIELGETNKARAHLRKAIATAEKASYDKLNALALSHMAVVFYRASDPAAAESYALRSNVIARPREYTSIIFRNCYYLREIASERSDRAAVRSNERTLNAYLSRVEADMPEAIRYRGRLAEEQQ